MISNTDLFFKRAKEYQDKRKGIVDAYEQREKQLKDAKGSKYYSDQMKAAAAARDAALEALQAEYADYFRISLEAMSAANGKRGVVPPTAEQVAVLQVLKMRGKVDDAHRSAFQRELDRAANSCADNPMCISVINDIARENGIMRVYSSSAKEMSIEDADRAIRNLRDALSDFMRYDTSRAARIGQEHYARVYGAANIGQPLAKRPLFDTKEDCFETITHGSLKGGSIEAFCAAVDSAE